MSENDISILDWLGKKIRNLKPWIISLIKPSSESSTANKTAGEDENTAEAGSETGSAESSAVIEAAKPLVQVNISMIVPSGQTVDAKVNTSNDPALPPATLETIPEVSTKSINVFPSTGVLQVETPPSARKTSKEGALVITITLASVLVTLSILLYLFTRFAGLNRFPVFFFSDEAMQTIYAEKLIDNHFLYPNDEQIPVYVPVEGDRWSPMISTYLQAISLSIFGKSVLQTRATSIFIGFLGVIAVALILKLIFKQKYWWASILLLSLLPAWFLHSRTAFETVMATAFFAIFLLFYLLYRYRNPWFLFGAVFFGWITFYSYSNSQALMGLTAIGLFISDFNYHKKQIKIILWNLPLILIMAIPFIIFEIKIPDALAAHLRAINSYWYQHISTGEKLLTFLKNYLIGLSPQYWFMENGRDLIRHRMVGYGHIPLWTLPLFVIGVVLSVKKIKESAYRVILIAALAAPVGGSMLEISIARTLAFIVPATILIMFGLEWVLGWVERVLKPALVAAVAFVILSALSIVTMNDAIINGPFWTNVYGLYGLQYGAVQIFQDTLPSYVNDSNTRNIVVSPVWANATDRFVDFFFTKEQSRRIYIDGVDTYLLRKEDISLQDVFVWTADEYQRVLESGKFDPVEVEKVILYPNGEPGFYVVRMKYVDNIDEVFAAEKAERSKPTVEEIELDGQPVTVTYSRLDGGELSNIFDGDKNSLMRGLEANPFLIQLEFSEPRIISGFDLTTASMDDFTVTTKVYIDENSEPTVYEENFKDSPPDPTVQIDINPEKQPITKLVIEIKHNTLEDPTHIHIRELKLR